MKPLIARMINVFNILYWNKIEYTVHVFTDKPIFDLLCCARKTMSFLQLEQASFH